MTSFKLIVRTPEPVTADPVVLLAGDEDDEMGCFKGLISTGGVHKTRMFSFPLFGRSSHKSCSAPVGSLLRSSCNEARDSSLLKVSLSNMEMAKVVDGGAVAG